MGKATHKQVFYADGDRSSGGHIPAAIRRAGLKLTCFRGIQDCLGSLASSRCDLLISNVRRPKVEGIQLLVRSRCIIFGLPVVMLVDRGDIGTAVRAIKAGALDCLERPAKTPELLAAIDRGLNASARQEGALSVRLSPMEKRVLSLILQGYSNHDIASVLTRSERTVEVHRYHVMHKLGVRNVVELANQCVLMPLPGE